jgi:hypothetical protein
LYAAEDASRRLVELRLDRQGDRLAPIAYATQPPDETFDIGSFLWCGVITLVVLDMAGLVDGQALDADRCIIGAGAASISLALQFVNRGLEVLPVESGGRRREADIQDMYAGSVVQPHLHAATDRFRCRQFCGSTALWGGRCMPDPIDFDARSYVPHSGWPVTLDELLAF